MDGKLQMTQTSWGTYAENKILFALRQRIVQAVPNWLLVWGMFETTIEENVPCTSNIFLQVQWHGSAS